MALSAEPFCEMQWFIPGVWSCDARGGQDPHILACITGFYDCIQDPPW